MTTTPGSRVLLLTGKGGVGKTTVAAATAVRIAAGGRRVLLTSTDPAHSLADVLGVPLGDAPRAVAPGLVAQQLDAQARLEQHWHLVRDTLVDLLASAGMDRVQAEEAVLLPGLEELFALVDLQEHVATGAHDVVVVDCAPTAETMRLLALPEALGFWSRRVLGRRGSGAAAPLARAVTGVRVPDRAVLAAAERLRADLGRVHELLRDSSRTSVRLVTAPEQLVLDETVRTATTLALLGHAVDAVVVNRILPDEVTDPWMAGWKQRHAQHLLHARATFAPTPVLELPLAADEPVGLAALAALAERCYGELDPAAVLHRGEGLRLEADGTGWVLSLPLPHARSRDLVVGRSGQDLHVRVGGARRVVPLPARLRRCDVAGAGLAGGRLTVRFRDRVATTAADRPAAAS